MSERCEWTYKWKNEWPGTYVPILGCSEPLWMAKNVTCVKENGLLSTFNITIVPTPFVSYLDLPVCSFSSNIYDSPRFIALRVLHTILILFSFLSNFHYPPCHDLLLWPRFLYSLIYHGNFFHTS